MGQDRDLEEPDASAAPKRRGLKRAIGDKRSRRLQSGPFPADSSACGCLKRSGGTLIVRPATRGPQGLKPSQGGAFEGVRLVSGIEGWAERLIPAVGVR